MPSSEITKKDQIWSIISTIKFASLVNLEGEYIKARPMTLVQDNFSGKIFFFTKESNEKSINYIDTKKVAIIFNDNENKNFATLNGDAKLTKERNLINSFWNFMVSAWYPEGKSSDELCLIEIKVNNAEIWRNEKGKIGSLTEVMLAKMNDRNPELGSKESLTLN
jgi:general stress protein 26